MLYKFYDINNLVLCGIDQSKLVSIVEVNSIRTYPRKTNAKYIHDRKGSEEHFHQELGN